MQAQCSWQEGDARGGLKAQLQALLAALEAQQAQQDGASSAGPSSTAATTAAAGSAFFPAPASTAGGGTSVAARQEARRAEQLGVIVGLPSSEDVKGLLEGLEAADKLRLAGNAAVKAGKASEAVTKYSEALQGEQSLGEVGPAKCGEICQANWCFQHGSAGQPDPECAPGVTCPLLLPPLLTCSQRAVPRHHGGAAV